MRSGLTYMATVQLTSSLPSPSTTRDPTPLNTQEQDEDHRHTPPAGSDLEGHGMFDQVHRWKSDSQPMPLRLPASGLRHNDQNMSSSALVAPLVFGPPKYHAHSLYPLADTETPSEWKRFTFEVDSETAVFEEVEPPHPHLLFMNANVASSTKSFQEPSFVQSLRKRTSSCFSDFDLDDTRKSRKRAETCADQSMAALNADSANSNINPLCSPIANDNKLDDQPSAANRESPSLLDCLQDIPHSDTRTTNTDEIYHHHHAIPLSYPTCPPSRPDLSVSVPDLGISTVSQTTDPPSTLPTPAVESNIPVGGTPDSALPSPSLSPLSIDHNEHDAEDAWTDTALIPSSSSPDDTEQHTPLPKHSDLHVEQALTDSISTPSTASLVNSYASLPSKIQSYIMLQILKRSSLEALRNASEFIIDTFRADILSKLPGALSHRILKYLDIQSLCRATSVCKRWKQMIDSNTVLWHDKFVEAGFVFMVQDRQEFATIKARHQTLDTYECACARDPKDCYLSVFQDSQSTEWPPVDNAKAIYNPYKEIYRRHYIMRYNWRHNRVRRIQLSGRPNNVVTCLQFDEEKIITGSDDQCVNVYDIKTGELIRVLEGHDGGVWALQYVGNLLVTGSTDRTIRIWDIDKGECRHIFRGHDSTVRCLTIVMPTSTMGSKLPKSAAVEPAYPMLVSGSRDATLRVWALPDLTSDRLQLRDETADEEEFDDVMMEDGTQSTFSEDEQYSDSTYHIHTLTGHTKSVRTLAAFGNIVASGSYDYTVRIWDIESGRSLGVLSGHDQKVYSVVLDHKRGRCISGSMDSTIRIWNVNEMSCEYVLGGHTILVGLLGLTDNYLVSAAADQTLRIWSPETGERKHILSGHQSAITSFQHDEHKIISGSEGGLKMWDVKTGELMHDLIQNINGVWRVAFDERRCVAAVKSNEITRLEILDYGVHSIRERQNESQ